MHPCPMQAGRVLIAQRRRRAQGFLSLSKILGYAAHNY